MRVRANAKTCIMLLVTAPLLQACSSSRVRMEELCYPSEEILSWSGYVRMGNAQYVRIVEAHESVEGRGSETGHVFDIAIRMSRRGPEDLWEPTETYVSFTAGTGQVVMLHSSSHDLRVSQAGSLLWVDGNVALEEVRKRNGPSLGWVGPPSLELKHVAVADDAIIACGIWSSDVVARSSPVLRWEHSGCNGKEELGSRVILSELRQRSRTRGGGK